jgi:uncharacterized protein YfaP (DUF2135 family)
VFAVLALTLTIASSPPLVKITAPLSGWTTQRLVTVTGTAEGAAPLAMLSVNGVERPLPIQGGIFEATFALGRGENAIEVIAPAADGASEPGRARNVREPSGEEVNYTSKESESGGRLDRDDTDGYGPEIYVLAAAPSGVYEIAAHYFGDHEESGQTSATVMVIAREGTDEEMRWRFEVPLVREGEMVELATIDLPPPGIKLDAKKKK